jgi:hypothetical protein
MGVQKQREYVEHLGNSYVIEGHKLREMEDNLFNMSQRLRLLTLEKDYALKKPDVRKTKMFPPPYDYQPKFKESKEMKKEEGIFDLFPEESRGREE